MGTGEPSLFEGRLHPGNRTRQRYSPLGEKTYNNIPKVSPRYPFYQRNATARFFLLVVCRRYIVKIRVSIQSSVIAVAHMGDRANARTGVPSSHLPHCPSLSAPQGRFNSEMPSCFVRRSALLCFILLSGLQATHAWGTIPAVTLTSASASNATFAQTNVSQTSGAQMLQLQLNQPLAISSIAVQQSTGNSQEFVVGSISGCTVNGTTVNPSGSVCSVLVTFAPAYPGLRQQPLVVVDSTGAVYSFGLTGFGNGPQTLILPGNVTTVSGLTGTTLSTPLGDGAAASAAALDAPEGLLVDNSSNIYIADTTHNRIRVIYQTGAELACLIEEENPTLFGLTAGAISCAGATSAPTAGFIYTIAGSGTGGYTSDAVLATSSELNAPGSVAVDAAGNVYIGDVTNFRIRVLFAGGAQAACLIEIENGASFGLGVGPTSCAGATSAPTPGYIYTIAGTGTSGWTGDGALADVARITSPYGIALDSSGDIFIATDSATAGTGSHIRVIYQGGANAAGLIALENSGVTPAVGSIYSVMGGLTSLTSAGDGGIATNGAMLYAYGISVDLNGNIYFPDKTSGTTPSVAKARVVFYNGSTLANLISLENGGITATPGFVYTIGGTSTVGSGPDGVLATASSLSGPYDVVVDPAGNVYLAERLNETIRKINATTGKISTIAGVAGSQNVTSGSATTTARLWGPWGLTLDSYGGIYFDDNGANRLRNDSAAAGTVTFASTVVNAASANQAVIVNNIGTGNLQLSGLSATMDFGITPPANVTGVSDCSSSILLAPGASCSVAISFSPQTGGTSTGTATVTDNSLSSTSTNSSAHSVALTGTGSGTTTTLTTLPAAPTYGQSVTLTAVVVDSSSKPVTSGTVTFSVGSTGLGTAPINPATGIASLTTTLLPGGTVTVNTVYPANGSYTESNMSSLISVAPAPVTITVIPATKLYGAALPAFSSINGATQNGDTLTIGYSTNATSASNVGTYTINATLTAVSATNYTATVTTALLSVTPATLTASANAVSRPVNTPNPTLTYTVTGLVNGDTSNILSGTPSLTTTAASASPVGNYTIAITQGTLAADANYSFALINGVLQVTYVGAQTITFSPIANVTFGVSPFTVNASSSSGLPVTISISSGTNAILSGTTSTLINGTVAVTGAGPLTLQANQAGNGSYPAAPAVSQSFAVAAAPLTVKASTTTYVYDAPTPLVGTVTGAVGSDSFAETFTTNSGTTTPVPVGTYTITPAVTPNGSTNVANYAVAYTNGTLTVSKAGTTTGLQSSSTNANLSAPVLFTATVASTTAGVPTGTVAFLADGTTTLGTGAVNGIGVATLSVSTLTAGSHSIVAAYGGDNNFKSSSNSAVSILVTAPAFSVSASATGIAITSGQKATVSLTVATVGGYSNTLTPSCGTTLPPGVSCVFAPSTIVFTGTNSAQTMVITINTVAGNAAMHDPLSRNELSILAAVVLWMPVSIAGIFGRRRKNRLKHWQQMGVLAFALLGGLVAMGSVTGCGSSNRTDAPLGTFNVPVTLTDGTSSSTLNVTVTITGTSSVS